MKPKNVVSIRKKEPKPTQFGTWGNGIATRKRRGLQFAYEWFSPSGSNLDTSNYQRPFRFLTDDQCWDVYRRCADVRASVDSIVRRVSTFDWIVTPTLDPHDERYHELLDVCNDVKGFLLRPNKNGDTWQEIMTAFLTDTLVFDAGVMELAFDREGNLQELVPLRGSTIFPIIDQYGRVVKYEQSSIGANDISFAVTDPKDVDPEFNPSEIIYFSLFKNTTNPEGNPLIEALVQEVISLMRATEHAMLNLDADEIPPGILVLAGIAGRAADEAKADLQKLKGQDHKIRVMTTPDPSGVGAQWVELRRTPKDIEMRDIILDIRRTIYRVFGVMPVEMGMTQDMPRATATAQLDVASSHLVTPILELLQAKINAQIIPSLIQDEEISKFVEFRFDREARLTAKEQNELSSTHQNYVRNGIMTRNEVRDVLGLLPLPGGDTATLEVAGMPTPLHTFGSPPEEVGDDFKVEPFTDKELEEDVEEEGIDPELDEIVAEERAKTDYGKKSNAKAAMDNLPAKTQKALKNKGKEHNDEHGKVKSKKIPNINYLAVSYYRGIGAYNTNPSSVRPTVTSAEQWAMARVNGLLFALRNGKFKRKPYDTDLLPKEHPSYKKET